MMNQNNISDINRKKLRCPRTGSILLDDISGLINQEGTEVYRVSDSGVPLFAEKLISVDSQIQQQHYDKVAQKYVENLGYPHTIEYTSYLDNKFIKQFDFDKIGHVAEICCGHGELLSLTDKNDITGVGVDISLNMLEYARTKHSQCATFNFVQGDATRLPLGDSEFDNVFMFGGIHHVPDREKLFSEVSRILRPGGKFYFREPVSDFFLWRWLRRIIYKVSPALDSNTERPLIWGETVPLLEKNGFSLEKWETYGSVGFCFFMNSDVLVFNRLFRFVPGIVHITRFAAYLDDLIVKIPGLKNSGLQVIGVAKKEEIKT